MEEEGVMEEKKVEEEVSKPREKRGDDNVVFIGKKGIMSYVLAVVTQFNNGSSDVIIKARGRAISRAVDVAEIVRQRFVSDLQVKDIQISTEEIQGDRDEGMIKVSAIEITLSK